MAEKETIYTDETGERRESKPFPGWVYFTEYIFDGDEVSVATGINQELSPGGNGG